MSSVACLERGVIEHLKGLGKLGPAVNMPRLVNGLEDSRGYTGIKLICRLNHISIVPNGLGYVEGGQDGRDGDPHRRHCHVSSRTNPNEDQPRRADFSRTYLRQ